MALIESVGIKYGDIDSRGPKFYFKNYDDVDAFIKTANLFAANPNKMKWLYLDEIPAKSQVEEELVFDNPYYAVFLNLAWITASGITYESYVKKLAINSPKVYHTLTEFCNAVTTPQDPKCDALYSIEDGRLMKKIGECKDADLRHRIADALITYVLMMESECKYGKYRDLLKEYDQIDKYYV